MRIVQRVPCSRRRFEARKTAVRRRPAAVPTSCVVDQFDDSHRDGGADEIDRPIEKRSAWATIGRRGCFARSGRTTSVESTFTMQYAARAAAIGAACERPRELSERAAQRLMRQAGRLYRGCDRDDVHQRPQVPVRVLRIGEASGQRARDCDEQRGMRSENQ